MNERHIDFLPQFILPLIKRTKTQTRRIVKPQPDVVNKLGAFHRSLMVHCPYGHPGDRLWVRETWGLRDGFCDSVFYKAGMLTRPIPADVREWRSPVTMPRWASRITLEITDVRVERVQEIRNDFHALIAEGVGEDGETPWGVECRFAKLWDEICGPGAWERNDWVWAIIFRRIV